MRVVLVGPKGDWDLLARRAPTVTDFTMRAEVIYNQLQLHALAGPEQARVHWTNENKSQPRQSA